MRGEDVLFIILTYSRAETPPRAWGRRHDTGEPPGSGETPPRAWGRPPLPSKLVRTTRNTPTCVGKTAQSPAAMAARRKHPHVRGEDGGAWAGTGASTETPPRAWGRPNPVFVLYPVKRNTPTCVGKTFFQIWKNTPPRKHPHVRGEDTTGARRPERRMETPPRAWGRPL